METLRRFLQWFVNGLGLGCGVVLIVLLAGKLGVSQPDDSPRFDLPTTSVKLEQVEPIAFAEQVTVAAMLSSTAGSAINVETELVLVVNGKPVYTCTNHLLFDKPPVQPQRVQVECRSLKRSAAPDGSSFQLNVKRVTRMRT